ncbi:hypothetical protein [Sphaerochaeta globosa]|uniref:DOD-type homing endonuclease domain-containing protein n=1 Tax=Sphaerochaeta globosa (strain ATCC BAA-1886 / DSM 22777 / Buddy) TaxID=158189 RepID=F0RRD5_SPHGB|nr:hypothetical protein [Sphaerochaeta globosa]ADY14187.1 hypothetical protein SpiBuddy_2372 [Sphaerochaeta globosa str. Buddy]
MKDITGTEFIESELNQLDSHDGFVDSEADCGNSGLSSNTPVLTKTGWKKHGELQVGDSVYTPRGLSKVLSVKHYPNSQCMKVGFRGNQEIICGSAHSWKVMKWNSKRAKGEKRVGWESVHNQTSQLMSNHKHPYIPVTGYSSSPVDLPIEPYTLGAWLGDGDNSGGRVCGPDEEVFESIRKDGYKLSESHCPTRAPFQTRTVYNLVKELRKQNLLHNKHIPSIYFAASVEQRLALLQGLMDTDGNMSRMYGNGATFVQKKEQLSLDVLALVNSLGFRAGICKTEVAHYVSFSISENDLVPFRVQRKIDNIKKFQSQKQSKNWYGQSVEKCETVPTNTIQIADPAGIYLIGYALIPTCSNLDSVNKYKKSGVEDKLCS